MMRNTLDGCFAGTGKHAQRMRSHYSQQSTTDIWEEIALNSLERVRATIAGQPVDHLTCQPMLMQFAASYSDMKFIDYTKDGR